MALEEHFDFEGGAVIKTKVGGSRVFFISTRGWAVIEKQLRTVFSSGASVILTEIGVAYGKGVAKEVMTSAKEPSVVLKSLEELSQSAGWGVVKVRGDLTGGQSLEVQVASCAFCASGEVGRDARCHFMAGVFAGAAAEAFGVQYIATEVQCVRKGDPLCVVSLKPSGK